MAIKIRKRQGDGERTPASDASENAPIEMESGAPRVGVAPAGSDPILDATLQGVSWVERNRSLVLGAILLAVVAALGVWIYSAYSSSQQVQASQVLSPALWEYETLLADSPTMDQIKESGVIPPPEHTFANETERWQQIYDVAGKALAENSSGPIAQSARVTRAAAALHLQKNDEAIKLYTEYLAGKTSDALVPLAYMGLGSAYAAEGKVDEAAANFDKLSKTNAAWATTANFAKARVFDAAGKKEQARELYHEILEADPDTQHRDEIERALALL